MNMKSPARHDIKFLVSPLSATGGHGFVCMDTRRLDVSYAEYPGKDGVRFT